MQIILWTINGRTKKQPVVIPLVSRFFLGHSMKSLWAIKLYGQLMTLKLIACSSNLFHVLWIMAFNKIAVFALWHQMEIIRIYNYNWCVFHFCDMWSQGGCHVYLVHPIQWTYWAHKLEASNLNQKNSHFQHLLIIVCRKNYGLNFSLFKGAQVFSIMAFYETHAYSYFYHSYFGYMFLLSQRYSLFLDFMQSFRVLDFFCLRYANMSNFCFFPSHVLKLSLRALFSNSFVSYL